MNNRIRFEKSIGAAEILSPSTGFQSQIQFIERRKDTLLDRWCRINVERAKRPKDRVGDASVIQLVESTRKSCPFCPDRIPSSTPMFPNSLVQEGRIRMGESVAFPNLFAFAQYHAVIVLTEEHYLPLNKISPHQIADGLRVAIKYIKAVISCNPKVRFSSINWNNLPTAAASMVHPHLQVIADESPTRYAIEALMASKAYYKKNAANYWDDLLQAEVENGERFIGDFGGTKWLASYSGLGNNDVLGIASASNLLELSEIDLIDLSVGISAMLKGYYAIGVQGFNLSIQSGPLFETTPEYKVHIKMISRPDLKPMNTADTGFMERLHDEVVVETSPEQLAKRIKEEIMR